MRVAEQVREVRSAAGELPHLRQLADRAERLEATAAQPPVDRADVERVLLADGPRVGGRGAHSRTFATTGWPESRRTNGRPASGASASRPNAGAAWWTSAPTGSASAMPPRLPASHSSDAAEAPALPARRSASSSRI